MNHVTLSVSKLPHSVMREDDELPACHSEFPMPRGGMRPGKKLLGGHAERVCDARFVAARLQRSISHWEFLGSELTARLSLRRTTSEESRIRTS
jgi:hypothetical protein